MYTDAEIKKVQKILLNMATSIRDVLDRHSIPHMITYGTLLGAVRHKGFIPWDDDFDFYIIGDEYENAIEFLRSELPSTIFIEDEKSEPLYFHGWAHAKDVNTVAECDLFPQDNYYSHHGVSIDLYRAFIIKRSYDSVNRLKAHVEYLKRKLVKGIISREEYEDKSLTVNNELVREESLIANVDMSAEPDIVGFISIHQDSMAWSDVFPLRKYEFENSFFWGPNNADILLKKCYGNYWEYPPLEKRTPHYSNVDFLDVL